MNNFNKKKWLIGIIGVLIVLFLGHWYGQYSQEQEAQRIKKEMQQVEADYQKGIQEIEECKYDKAQITLSRFSKGNYDGDERYWDARILYAYAHANIMKDDLKLYKEQAYRLAQDLYLKSIPDTYNGHFAKRIQNLKKDVAETLAGYEEGHKYAQKYKEEHIYVGDSDVKVLEVLGEPERKNRTTTGNTTREQWVYGNGQYIYIENGSVTAFQD